VDDRALAEALAAGHPGGLLALHDAYVDRLHAYATALLGEDGGTAAAAVQDALLVAAERAGQLAEPARLGVWVYALTRNECLRRQATPDPGADAAELLRHGLGPRDLAAVLGVSHDEVHTRLTLAGGPDGPVAVRPAPAGLRAQLTADAAVPDYRAALAARAAPYGADGFPLPLDRHRLSGRVLTWSTVAVVLGALLVLVLVPGAGGEAGAGAALAALPEEGGAGAPALVPRAEPSFSPPVDFSLAPASTLQPLPHPPAPTATEDRAGAERATRRRGLSRPSPSPAAPSAEPDPTGQGPASGHGDSIAAGSAVITWYEDASAADCDPLWTARVHAVVVGIDPTTVEARWTDGERTVTVPLRRDQDDLWTGDLAGLATDRRTWMVATAVASPGIEVDSPRRRLDRRCVPR